MIRFSLIALVFFMIVPLAISDVFAQVGAGESPFERKFGDVKFLDAYFGTEDEKMEVDPGDRNVPFTVIMANVGTQDITGIRGQLAMPFTFSSSDGPGTLIIADSDSNSLAGENFAITFFVNIGDKSEIKTYPSHLFAAISALSGPRYLLLFIHS